MVTFLTYTFFDSHPPCHPIHHLDSPPIPCKFAPKPVCYLLPMHQRHYRSPVCARHVSPIPPSAHVGANLVEVRASSAHPGACPWRLSARWQPPVVALRHRKATVTRPQARYPVPGVFDHSPGVEQIVDSALGQAVHAPRRVGRTADAGQFQFFCHRHARLPARSPTPCPAPANHCAAIIPTGAWRGFHPIEATACDSAAGLGHAACSAAKRQNQSLSGRWLDWRASPDAIKSAGDEICKYHSRQSNGYS